MVRYILLAHRYLGIGLGLLMFCWCVSGIVMMYVGYPRLSQKDRLSALPDLKLEACCQINLSDQKTVDGLTIAMMAGKAVLRIEEPFSTVTLTNGRQVKTINHELILRDYLKINELTEKFHYLGLIERDQWTVAGSYDRHRPLHHYGLKDKSRTEIYISSQTGEILQMTISSQRFWNWIGAVTHWIYPAILRQNPALWTQVVIWLSIFGTFLTLTGIYMGLKQFRKGKNKWSPYKGYAYWHHISGLLIGLLILTWVFSGLLSMTPYGLLDHTPAKTEREILKGGPVTLKILQSAIAGLNRFPEKIPAGTKRLKISMFAGKAFITTFDHKEQRLRLRAKDLTESPLSMDRLQSLVNSFMPEHNILSFDRISTGDSYYYSHHRKKHFPVYRVIFNDSDQTRYYLDDRDGSLLQKTDQNGKIYRWLFNGLHRWDFSNAVRSRPFWDMLILPFMGLMTFSCFTGFYLGCKRLTRRKKITKKPQVK